MSTQKVSKTYIVFVSNMKFKLKWFTCGEVHLENQILMDNVETCIDTHLLCRHRVRIVVEIGRNCLWVGRQLDALCIQGEVITLDLLVVFFLDF